MFEAGLVSLLSSTPALMATLGDRHIYPGGFVPENAVYPCLAYTIITGRDNYTFETKVDTETLVQFDALGPTYESCVLIKDQLRRLLSGFEGTLIDGTHVLGVIHNQDLDLNFDFTRNYRRVAEYRFLYVEPFS